MMKKKNKTTLLLVLLCFILGGILYSHYNDKNNNNIQNEEVIEQTGQEQYSPPVPVMMRHIVADQTIVRSPKQLNALDRVYNPLRYPYRSQPFYDQSWYPNMALEPHVIGCGGRMTPCMGGTQIPISNPMPPINISNSNIAPINIRTRGPLGEPQQVGVISKVFGNENQMYPLYGRMKYPNGSKWEYYTTMGPYGVKIPVPSRNNDELGNNDEVKIPGQKGKYRVNIYESDFPQYIPYV